jgi:hypothetical protein
MHGGNGRFEGDLVLVLTVAVWLVADCGLSTYQKYIEADASYNV